MSKNNTSPTGISVEQTPSYDVHADNMHKQINKRFGSMGTSHTNFTLIENGVATDASAGVR